MRAYVLVKTQVGETVNVVKTLRKCPEVTSADVTFGPYDAVVEIQADSLDSIGQLVTQVVHSAPGVTETLTCPAVDIA